MMLLLAQLWAAVRVRPVLSACLAIAVVAGLANYPLWQRRMAVTQRHDRGKGFLHAPVEVYVGAIAYGVLEGGKGVNDVAHRRRLDDQHLHAAAGTFSKRSAAAVTRATSSVFRQLRCPSGQIFLWQGEQGR